MRRLAFLLILFLAGCAPTAEEIQTDSVAEADLLVKPSRQLSSFASYELRPLTYINDIAIDRRKEKNAKILEAKLREKIVPLFRKWSTSPGPGRQGTLVVHPNLVKLRVISRAGRFWGGWYRGGSNIELDLNLIDSGTGKVIATALVQRGTTADDGSGTFGESDRALHDYIATIVYEYLVKHY